MALTNLPRSTRWTLCAAALCLAGAAWAAQAWWSARTWNEAIASGQDFDRVMVPTLAASGASAATAVSAPGLSRATLDGMRPASGAASGAAAVAEPPWLRDGRPLQWRFANALHLAEAGDVDGALARFRSLYEHPSLGLAARYNTANILLRQALAVRASDQPGQAIVLLELAKEAYRTVLRIDPDHWDARYNLERVQRLQPDPSAEDLEGAEPPKQAERAATTMRGVSKGLP